MHPGEKMRVVKETTVLRRVHHVEARIANVRGDTLYVDARWGDFETPTFSIGVNTEGEIEHLYAEDLSLLVDLCQAALEGVIEVKKEQEAKDEQV